MEHDQGPVALQGLQPPFQIIEFLERRLYLGSFAETPLPKYIQTRFITLDPDEFVSYVPFFLDFGPMNISQIYRFALRMNEVINESNGQNDKPVLVFTDDNEHTRANVACILAAYLMLIQNWAPHHVLTPLMEAKPAYLPFRDAGYSDANFGLSIQDCVYGLWRAKEADLLDIRELNLADYETHEQVENGDFNWITKHFIAFASPQEPNYSENSSMPVLDYGTDRSESTSSSNSSSSSGIIDDDVNLGLSRAFNTVLKYFQQSNVRLVVRLNSPLYHSSHFIRRGIKHVDMFFEDGSVPEMSMVKSFIEMVENVQLEDKDAVVAVHCKAGLGRTGCLIGAYLIYRYAFTANEIIAYMRILRPGMVVGPQQHWLHINQAKFREWYFERSFRQTFKSETVTATSRDLSSDCLLSFKKEQRTTNIHIETIENNIHTPSRSALKEIQVGSESIDLSLPEPTPVQPRKSGRCTRTPSALETKSPASRIMCQKLLDAANDENESKTQDKYIELDVPLENSSPSRIKQSLYPERRRPEAKTQNAMSSPNSAKKSSRTVSSGSASVSKSHNTILNTRRVTSVGRSSCASSVSILKDQTPTRIHKTRQSPRKISLKDK